MSEPPLKISVFMEHNQIKYDEIGQIWGMIELVPINLSKDAEIIIAYCANSMENLGALQNIFPDMIIINPTISDIIQFIIAKQPQKNIIIITDLDDPKWEQTFLSTNACHIIDIGLRNSKLLFQLSQKIGGYYYTTFQKNIVYVVNDCISKIKIININSVNIKLIAHDGSRIINVYTPAGITEIICAKEYQINIHHLEKMKTILFKLSIRGYNHCFNHNILRTDITYNDANLNMNHMFTQELFIQRVDFQLCNPLSELDPKGETPLIKKINTYLMIIKILNIINNHSGSVIQKRIFQNINLTNDISDCFDPNINSSHPSMICDVISTRLMENY